MAAAAARLGCTPGDLKRAKSAGCSGFVHGRVRLSAVRKWLEENPPDEEDLSEDALKRRKLLAQCKKLELDESITKGEYTPNHEVIRMATALASMVRSELLLLCSEAPTWQGLDAPILQDKAKAFVHGALDRLSRFDVKEAKA